VRGNQPGWTRRRRFIRLTGRLVPSVPAGTPAGDLRGELERTRERNAELEQTILNLTRSVQELEAFSRELSHDLKGPLTGISGYAQLLTHLDVGYPRPAEFDEFVAEITDGTERMRWLIDDVLEYATARGAQLHLADIELAPLVDEVVSARLRDLRHQAGVGGPPPRITIEPLPGVRGDQVMLRRLFDNLFANALKYVRPGEPPEVHVSTRQAGAGWLRVEVTDRGIGIPDGQHEAIFAELHRAHADAGYPGTGLGLTICRRIVERIGGSIGADEAFRDGTRIWFCLPTAHAVGANENHGPVRELTVP
jgi:signal transduction histidine kinase